MRAALGVILILLAACGDEPAPPPPTAQPKVAKAAPTKTKELKPRPRIEDRVQCPTPTDALRCDPAAPKCATGEYCLAAGTDHYCGPCPERDSIRHAFTPRDFAEGREEDPFARDLRRVDDVTDEPVATSHCPPDRVKAATLNYQQLKLRGILSQGALRKALVTAGPDDYILAKGDCAGRERVLVTDIGASFVTFKITDAHTVSEYSLQMHNDLQ